MIITGFTVYTYSVEINEGMAGTLMLDLNVLLEYFARIRNNILEYPNSWGSGTVRL